MPDPTPADRLALALCHANAVMAARLEKQP
jgi:Holliday junction resolvasome RuvABC endonuclease subunit